MLMVGDGRGGSGGRVVVALVVDGGGEVALVAGGGGEVALVAGGGGEGGGGEVEMDTGGVTDITTGCKGLGLSISPRCLCLSF